MPRSKLLSIYQKLSKQGGKSKKSGNFLAAFNKNIEQLRDMGCEDEDILDVLNQFETCAESIKETYHEHCPEDKDDKNGPGD